MMSRAAPAIVGMDDMASPQGSEEPFSGESGKIRQALLATNEGGRGHV
jgi:hypothetical protein